MAFSPFVCRGKAVLTVPQNERGIYAPAWTKIENVAAISKYNAGLL
jgi:membrane-bound lytic murein transglycosylase B